MTITDAPYVLTTTFRRTGEAVSTPTWLVPLGPGRAGMTTSVDSGKVKRLAHTPRVTLVPCSPRGRVRPGSTQVEAGAQIVRSGPELEEVRTALRTKYGLKYPLYTQIQTLASRARRKPPTVMCVVILSLPAGA